VITLPGSVATRGAAGLALRERAMPPVRGMEVVCGSVVCGSVVCGSAVPPVQGIEVVCGSAV
jgi:hypothetical protein